MKRAWDFAQVVGGLVLLGMMAVGLIAVFQAARGGAPVPALQVTVQTTEGYPPLPDVTIVPQGYPLPTPAPTLSPPEVTATWGAWIAEATASVPTPLPTPGPLIGPQIIYDPSGQFTMTLLSGWRAYVGGTTVIINYDDEQLSDVHTFPPGGLKIQIGVGELDPGESFEQWLSNWIAISLSPPPDSGLPNLTATEPQPYTLGNYDGVTYIINDEYSIMEIVLSLSAERVMVIGLTPADSPALPEALSMLSTVEALAESLP